MTTIANLSLDSTPAQRNIPDYIDLAIVGGGTQALTLVAHLLQKHKKKRDKFLVFEPSGEWLSQWRRQFDNLEIPHLRSPAVHNPDTNPFALRAFAEKRPQELYPPYDLPGTKLFEDFCREVVRKWQLDNCLIPYQAERIIPIPKGLSTRYRLIFTNTKEIIARQVVIAKGGGNLNIPHWVEKIEENYPLERLQHSQNIDLSRSRLQGEKILIIGGGLTGGHLAIGAIERGATVVLMARREFQEKLFDADPGWLGPKYLKDFFAENNLDRRWQMIQQARNGGSLTPKIMLQLRRYSREEKIILDDFCEVVQANWNGKKWQVECSREKTNNYDRIWLATGTKLDITQDSLFQDILSFYRPEIVRGLPVLDKYLAIPKSNVFIMGGLAALQVGPTARNLSGARMASPTIVDGLCKSHSIV
jgi:cation diffusion facilitator CzcD-associated flavoprotein CzcO